MIGLQAKLYAIGAALLAGLAFFVRFQAVKNQRDKAELQRDVLKARSHVAVVQKKIERAAKKELIKKKKEIKEKISQPKEEFEGIDSLSDSNDF